MFFGRWTSWQAAGRVCASSGLTSLGLLIISTGLIAGCSGASTAPADSYADYQPTITWSEHTSEITPVANVQPKNQANQLSKYWSFPTGNSEHGAEASHTLRQLPAIAEPTSADAIVVEDLAAPETASSGQPMVNEQPIAMLLPPQELPSRSIVVRRTNKTVPEPTSLPSELREIAREEIASASKHTPPVLEKLTEQERLLTLALRDSTSAATGVLTDSRVNELAKSKIQHAYAMASRGGMYVARKELIEVLRMISQAKDAQHGTPERSVALAAGLRALREAEDFEPRGAQLEAEMDIKVLCASHRTPVAKQEENAKLLPRLMMDRYLRYAQLQLALSVAGEPAGSMALHALGKLSSQLGRVEPEQHRLANRQAVAYQQASLLAHNQNYLAAHELAVLLATSGHYAESQQLLLQVASRAPNAVVYRNLARVQQQLGQPTRALANREHARQLASQGATGTDNVQWVSPEQFAQSTFQTPRYASAQRTVTGQVVTPGTGRPAPTTVRR